MAAPRGLLQVLRVRGLLPYAEGLARQEALAAAVAGGAPAALLLCEHPPTYTVGHRGTRQPLPSAAALGALGASLHATPRGGDATFHGPGQLMLYPVVALRRHRLGARAFVEGMEDVVVAAAARFGVATEGRRPGAPGVWVAGAPRKVAAVGVRIGGGVSTHGAALNVSTDLAFFSHIVPCGLEGMGVTSLAAELGGAAPPMEAVAAEVAASFAAHFGFAAEEVGADF